MVSYRAWYRGAGKLCVIPVGMKRQSFHKYEIFVIFDAEDLTDDGLCIKIMMDRCII